MVQQGLSEFKPTNRFCNMLDVLEGERSDGSSLRNSTFDYGNTASMLERIVSARDTFLVWLSQKDGRIEDGQEGSLNLWGHFELWLRSLWQGSPTENWPFWFNHLRREEAWREFLALVPLIYLAAFDEILRDPCKFDYVNGDMVIHRAMKTVLPRSSLLDHDELTSDDHNIDSLAQLVVGASGFWPSLVDVTTKD